MNDRENFDALIGASIKCAMLKSTATPEQKHILEAAIITAKVAAANAAKQMNADLDAVLISIANDLNGTAKKIFAEKG